jgi:hypothetical protein
VVIGHGEQEGPMTTAQSPVRWTPVPEFAVAHNFDVDEVITRIQNGTLNGLVIGARWYVLHDLVTLDIPDKAQPQHAVLRIACNRADNRLTAGCDTVLELDLTYGDELRTIIGQFFGPENVPPEEPINVVLGGQEWTVDHSLHGELLGNLLVWQVEVELGDLLVQYPPDPVH